MKYWLNPNVNAGLSMHAVHNVKECETMMAHGFGNRHVGATLMNADSSRLIHPNLNVICLFKCNMLISMQYL